MGLEKIAILGAGNLGMANALYMARRVPEIILYDRNEDAVSYLNETRQHKRHFQDLYLPNSVKATSNIKDLEGASLIIVDLHSTGIRSVFQKIAPYLENGVVIVNDSKGLHRGKFPLQIISEETEGIEAVLAARSGWMLASHIAYENEFCYAEIASENMGVAEKFAQLTESDHFMVQTSMDVIGVQAAGVLKNTYSIFAGFCDGRSREEAEKAQLHHSIKKEYLEIAKKEATSIAIRLGGKQQTFRFGGYSWWKDFYNSSYKNTANRRLGELIGMGETPEKALASVQKEKGRVPEGYHSTRELRNITDSNYPVLNRTYEVLFEGKPVSDAIIEAAYELSNGFDEFSRALFLSAAETIAGS